MNVLIVAEKPSIAREIAPDARRHWPQARITLINTVPYGNFKFAYPRGQRWGDYPCVSAPQYKLPPWSEWMCPPLAMDAAGALSQAIMAPELLTGADLIVFACDPDHTGVGSFEVLLQQVFGDDRAKDCPALELYAIDEASLQDAFANLRPFGEVFAVHAEIGRVKRYFDWNWNVNAQAILGATARRVGVPSEAPPMSKYALQLLYGLRTHELRTYGQVIKLMSCWPGTGRYSLVTRLGSCASYGQIVENLLAAGLLEHVQSTKLTLSARGKAFLAALHPDCEDADLPFRLDAWGEQGLERAKPAMDRYLRTFFGKQKRRLA